MNAPEREAIAQGGTSGCVAESGPRVLVYTALYPNAQQPMHGVFVRERIRALGRRSRVQVMAPVPWAPPVRALGERYFGYSQVPRQEWQDGLQVHHPRFGVLPKVGKAADGLWMAAFTLPALRRVRRRFPFEVIDAHWAFPDGVAAALVARALALPLVLTVRGDDLNVIAQEPGRGLAIRYALRRASLVVALSRELAEKSRSLAPRTPVKVIANGVDGVRFHPGDRVAARARMGVAPDDQLLFSAGRLHASKGFPILIEAAARLRARFPRLLVVIAGAPDHEADARPAIEAAAARGGLQDRLRLVGPCPHDVLADWYRASDLFCLPTAREGSANVLLEALACGLPCVTTAVGGNPDLIDSDDLGRLTAATPEGFAEAIADCLLRPRDRKQIADRAGQRTWDRVAEECLDGLLGVLRGSSQRRE